MDELHKTKRCIKCGTAKDLASFSKSTRNCDGLQSRCKSCDCAAAAAYRLAHPEKVKAAVKKWDAKNTDRNKVRKAKWSAANKSRRSELRAAWYSANREKEKRYSSTWAAANPEKRRTYESNRKSKKMERGGALSPDIVEKLMLLQKGKCPCCQTLLGKDFHLDHIVPLALGGENKDRNMQLLHSKCNLQKHAKHPVDFMQKRGFLL